MQAVAKPLFRPGDLSRIRRKRAFAHKLGRLAVPIGIVSAAIFIAVISFTSLKGIERQNRFLEMAALEEPPFPATPERVTEEKPFIGKKPE